MRIYFGTDKTRIFVFRIKIVKQDLFRFRVDSIKTHILNPNWKINPEYLPFYIIKLSVLLITYIHYGKKNLMNMFLDRSIQNKLEFCYV